MAIADRGYGTMIKTEAGRIRHRNIASKAGKASHEKKAAHEWQAGAEAKSAGQKGGLATGRLARAKFLAKAGIGWVNIGGPPVPLSIIEGIAPTFAVRRLTWMDKCF